MTTILEQQKQNVEAQLAVQQERLKRIHLEIVGKDQELEELLETSQQFKLLDDICSSLAELDKLKATHLFWGQTSAEDQDQHMSHVMGHISGFRTKVDAIKGSREKLHQLFMKQEDAVNDLFYQLDDLEEEEELQKLEYVVERQEQELPFRPMLMPWVKQKEDQQRYRKVLACVCTLFFMVNILVAFWELPEITPEEIEVPEYLVQVVKKDKPKPKPVVKPKPKKKQPEKTEKKVAQQKDTPKDTTKEKKAARNKAETAGVLAFKDSFNDLLADDVDQKLGASANLRNTASSAKGSSSRSLVMSQAKNTSGGIRSAEVSRNIGGSAAGQMGQGLSFARVDSAIGTDMIADDRPLSDGVGPTRTDEEIQIVFDRYKAALYRIYNRELRKDPTLKGKMVLRITIEPDGSVSVASVESTNMASQTLEKGVLARVGRFNFGPKDGVPVITILYPIDFLPAA